MQIRAGRVMIWAIRPSPRFIAARHVNFNLPTSLEATNSIPSQVRLTEGAEYPTVSSGGGATGLARLAPIERFRDDARVRHQMSPGMAWEH